MSELNPIALARLPIPAMIDVLLDPELDRHDFWQGVGILSAACYVSGDDAFAKDLFDIAERQEPLAAWQAAVVYLTEIRDSLEWRANGTDLH
jgi:hypothetical protein